jgi:hypothetical protein
MSKATSTIAKMTAALESIGDDSFADLGSLLSGAFEQMEWAEDEIQQAQKRHQDAADLIYHSFKLLCQPHELMKKEQVYRAHSREILDRVAAGADTRPGTAAELCIACCESSQLAPLTTTATGLYARMWEQAFPAMSMQWDGVSKHYEALRGSQIDEAEREMRRKLADQDRRITEIDCHGMHHGEKVTCTAQAPGKRHAARQPVAAAA